MLKRLQCTAASTRSVFLAMPGAELRRNHEAIMLSLPKTFTKFGTPVRRFGPCREVAISMSISAKARRSGSESEERRS